MLQAEDGEKSQDHTSVIITALERKVVAQVSLSRVPPIHTKIDVQSFRHHCHSSLTPADTHVGRRELRDGATPSDISEILELLESLDEAENNIKCGGGESVLR